MSHIGLLLHCASVLRPVRCGMHLALQDFYPSGVPMCRGALATAPKGRQAHSPVRGCGRTQAFDALLCGVSALDLAEALVCCAKADTAHDRPNRTSCIAVRRARWAPACARARQRCDLQRPGQALFVRQGILFAQRDDPDALEFRGDPVRTAESVKYTGTSNSLLNCDPSTVIVHEELKVPVRE